MRGTLVAAEPQASTRLGCSTISSCGSGCAWLVVLLFCAIHQPGAEPGAVSSSGLPAVPDWQPHTSQVSRLLRRSAIRPLDFKNSKQDRWRLNAHRRRWHWPAGWPDRAGPPTARGRRPSPRRYRSSPIPPAIARWRSCATQHVRSEPRCIDLMSQIRCQARAKELRAGGLIGVE